MKSNYVSALLAKAALAVAAFSPLANAAEVELLDAFNITMSRHGQVSRIANFSAAVENLSSDKEVYIHRERADGTWVDVPMYFDAPAGNGKEVWKLRGTDDNGWGDEFVVKMVINGAEFWDNNNGNNYQVNGAGYTIGNGGEVFVSNWATHDAIEPGKTRLFSTIVLDNIGSNKDVELVYTFDGWATSTAVKAVFNGPFPLFGFGTYPNPSANNAESWNVSFEFPKGQQGEFYVKYSVDGVDYFDSNFGTNYRINPPTANGSMFLRSGPGWNTGRPMTAIADNLWATNMSVRTPFGVEQIKFDTFNDWSINFGDNDADGVAEFDGANIDVPEPGDYRVFFNDLTLEYTFQPYGVAN